MTRVVLSTVTPLFRPPISDKGIIDQSYRGARTVPSRSIILSDMRAYLSIEFTSSQLECYSIDEHGKKNITSPIVDSL
ncbi:hypothetical protein BDR03DRAFT_946280 [Suillus americanus]|nr:hypothetical protein BDR03DRAFT_946280 [Suillus americanus]